MLWAQEMGSILDRKIWRLLSFLTLDCKHPNTKLVFSSFQWLVGNFYLIRFWNEAKSIVARTHCLLTIRSELCNKDLLIHFPPPFHLFCFEEQQEGNPCRSDCLCVLQVLIMSVYSGVVFFRVKNDPNQLVMNLKRGVFFISVLNMTLINLGQLPALLEERAIYYKQQGAHFFRPQSFLFAKFFGGLPFSLLEVRVPSGCFIFSFTLTWLL